MNISSRLTTHLYVSTGSVSVQPDCFLPYWTLSYCLLGLYDMYSLGGLTPMCYVTANVISHSVVWIYRTFSLFFSFSTEAMQCLMSYVFKINPSKMTSSLWPDCIHVFPLFLDILHGFQNCLPACLIPETFWKRGMCGMRHKLAWFWCRWPFSFPGIPNSSSFLPHMHTD